MSRLRLGGVDLQRGAFSVMILAMVSGVCGGEGRIGSEVLLDGCY